jgi:hypothetical protein
MGRHILFSMSGSCKKRKKETQEKEKKLRKQDKNKMGIKNYKIKKPYILIFLT